MTMTMSTTAMLPVTLLVRHLADEMDEELETTMTMTKSTTATPPVTLLARHLADVMGRVVALKKNLKMFLT
jgi:hypothetical protein